MLGGITQASIPLRVRSFCTLPNIMEAALAHRTATLVERAAKSPWHSASPMNWYLEGREFYRAATGPALFSLPHNIRIRAFPVSDDRAP